MTATTADQGPDAGQEPTRRDFLSIVAATSAAVGAGVIAWPLVDSLNPSSDVLAMAFTEVDLTSIRPGQGIVLLWQGRPVFVRHRTPQEIEAAKSVQITELRDPQADADRVKAGHEQWLVVSGVCTHLGCVPGGSKASEARGEFGGWFCACHGSQYDTAGRIRKGPAPANLPLVPYEFLADDKVRIG
jgi:ubiquinol-cytochrome c reductase iron-sulfur subunit